MGLSTKILILLASAAAAFLGGWWTRDAFCDAADAQRQVVELRSQINAAKAAAELDQANAAKAAQDLANLEGVIRDLESKISDGVCLDGADADGLRGLWR